jgi:hypothetical protein
MSRNFSAIVAVVGVSVVLHAGAAAAQPVDCGDLYNRMMGLYQSAPQSPEYAQMYAAYNSSCAGGGPAGVGVGAGVMAPGGGVPSAMSFPESGLPMRGAPSTTVPTESPSIVRPGVGGMGGGSAGGGVGHAGGGGGRR